MSQLKGREKQDRSENMYARCKQNRDTGKVECSSNHKNGPPNCYSNLQRVGKLIYRHGQMQDTWIDKPTLIIVIAQSSSHVKENWCRQLLF